jgi:hypothetical protein
MPWPDETLLIRRYENVFARKLLEQGCWLAKIRGQNKSWLRNSIGGYISNRADHMARVQPDVQYVIHPSGTDIANALVLGARTTMFF